MLIWSNKRCPRAPRLIVLIIAVEMIGLALLLLKGVAVHRCETNALAISDKIESGTALLACAGKSEPDLLERERRAYDLLHQHENELKT